MRLLAICSISALLLVACSDDTEAPKPDQKTVTPDLSKGDAQPPKSDGKPTTSDGAGKLSCGAATTEAQVCAKACPSGLGQLPCLVKCNDDAKAKGCDSAKTLFDALVGCISTTCIVDCLTGPTPPCETCTKDKCKTQYDACYNTKC